MDDIVRRETPNTAPQPPEKPILSPQPALPPAPVADPSANRRTDIGAPLVSWSAPEYDYAPKSREWYWVVGIIATALVIVSALLRNLLFGILTVLAGFTVALYGARKPKIMRFAITARGVEIGSKLHPYESLASFWLRYEPPHIKELDIISKKLSAPRMTLPLGDANPNEIRAILMRTLKEVETEESFAESIGRFLGF